MRRVMLWGLGLVAVALAGWSLWWFAGAQVQEGAVSRWLDDQRGRGWQAEAEAVAVSGYPLAFNLDVTGLALADPQAGWAWTTPALDADSQAFQPNRIAVSLPGEHLLAVPGERMALGSARMTADLHVAARTSMALRETGIDIADLVIEGQTGWTASADRLAGRVAERDPALAPPDTYDIQIDAAAVVLPPRIVAALDPTGLISAQIDEVEISGFATFDRPLDREVVEGGHLALAGAVIRRAGFSWGTMRLDLRGQFEVGPDGFPVGELEVFARDWREMVRLSERGGVIGPDVADAIRGALEFLSLLAGDGTDITVPLGLDRGKIRLGPVAIADAPRLKVPRP